MKKLKRIWRILKSTSVDKALLGFLMYVFITSGVFLLVEPEMGTYGEALWYSFNVITTIGFGDYYAVTLIGRIFTIILGLYGLLVVALIPGVLVGYYMDFVQNKGEETMGNFLEKLENLEHLSKEELKEISKKVREGRYRE